MLNTVTKQKNKTEKREQEEQRNRRIELLSNCCRGKRQKRRTFKIAKVESKLYSKMKSKKNKEDIPHRDSLDLIPK